MGVKESLKQCVIGFGAIYERKTFILIFVLIKKVSEVKCDNIPFASWASELIIVASESEVKSSFKKRIVNIIRPETRWSIYEQVRKTEP